MLNANIRDPAKFLLNPPTFLASLISNQSIPNATWTELVWGTPWIDSDNIHPGSSATVTIVTSGLYDLRGQAYFASDADGVRAIGIDQYLDGVFQETLVRSGAISATNIENQGTVTSVGTALSTGKPVFLNAGDQLRMMAYQNAGGALNAFGHASEMYTWFSVRWIAES